MILKPEARDFLKEKGLEVQVLQEYTAMRTILVRGLEWCVAELSKNQTLPQIETGHPDWKIDKVVKIPNNTKLMKLVCKSTRIAEEIVTKDIIISNQKFTEWSLERETFISIILCLRCFKYEHTTKWCTNAYRVCSECSKEGHRFGECSSLIEKNY